MYPDVILLNGTGSSGKTSIAKALQETLPTQYLNFSIDSVLYALPPSDLQCMMKGEPITRDGYEYARLTRGYILSLRGLLEAGCRLIIDNAWIEQNEVDLLFDTLAGFDCVKVGVHCQLEVCQAREIARGDRAIGLAEYEYPLVHKTMEYDVEVDTSTISAQAAAEQLIRCLEAL